jgi:hypothetical protein
MNSIHEDSRNTIDRQTDSVSLSSRETLAVDNDNLSKNGERLYHIVVLVDN